jgi:biopolymer transport protein ExbB/TolQ
MLHLLRLRRPSLIYCGLGLAAIIGWSSFAYATWSARQLSRQLTSERNEARAKRDELQKGAGDLKQIEAKLSAARAEYSRAVEGWAQTRAKNDKAQLELAALAKRLEQAQDRVSQTGSIRQMEPPRRPAP